MRIPQYWTKASYTGTDDRGKPLTCDAWGWSLDDPAQAREDETTSIPTPTATEEVASAEGTATGEMTPTEESSPLEVTPSAGLNYCYHIDLYIYLNIY